MTVYGVDEDKAGEDVDSFIVDSIENVFALLRDYENMLSKTIETSEVSKINSANGEVKVSEDTFEVIQCAIKIGELSGGKFDVTIGKVVELWGFNEGETGHDGAVPDEEALKEALKHVDYTKIVLNKDNLTVTLEDSEAEIDLGGIAKGFIADKMAERLDEIGVTSAIVNLGGNIVCLNGKTRSKTGLLEDATDFAIGIKDPGGNKSSGIIATYKAKDITMITSGTYERYIETADGTKYHHILDVNTGYPCDTDVVQVTLIAKRGNSMMCDGLSTTCLSLGKDAAIRLIEGLEGFEAVVYTSDGGITYTSGLKDNSNFILE